MSSLKKENNCMRLTMAIKNLQQFSKSPSFFESVLIYVEYLFTILKISNGIVSNNEVIIPKKEKTIYRF